MTYKLLSVGHDAKTIKGQKQGYLTGILYMAPHTIGGGRSLCPYSTAGCRSVCLYTAGHGVFNSVQEARIRKTKFFLSDQRGFISTLVLDIAKLAKSAEKAGMTPAVRLNGTTDILWETLEIMEQFPSMQFYDYTKWPESKRPCNSLPLNYHLTYSFSEKPTAAQRAEEWLSVGTNVAVVFSGNLPAQWKGYNVFDGDQSDLRFLDPTPVIVGLKAKGYARKDNGNGFVQAGYP